MKKLICALIGAAALVASATTYIQTSSTGTAPWKPVKDSVSQAHLADSARHAPTSAYADSSRASGLADSAKRVSTTWLSSNYLPIIGGKMKGSITFDWPVDTIIYDDYYGNSDGIILNNYSSGIMETIRNYGTGAGLKVYNSNNQGIPTYGLWVYNHEGDPGSRGAVFEGTSIVLNCKGHSLFEDTLTSTSFMFANGFIVNGGTAKGFLKADGSVDSSGSISRSDSAISSSISDSAKILTKYLRNDRNDTLKNASFIVNNGAFRIYNNSVYSQYGFYTGNDAGWIERIAYNGVATMSQYKLSSLNTAPASSTATGTLGEIRWCNGYVYLCVATNTWQRAALTAW